MIFKAHKIDYLLRAFKRTPDIELVGMFIAYKLEYLLQYCIQVAVFVLNDLSVRI